MKFSLRKIVPAAALALASASAFAQGEVGSVDISNATDAIGSIQDGLEGILNALATPVASVVVAGIAIWAIPKVARALKRAFTGGQG